MKILASVLIIATLSFSPIFSLTGNKPDLTYLLTINNVYATRKDNIMITMRDGTRLSTDLFFPDETNEKLPVILIRTPINKASLGYLPITHGCLRARFRNSLSNPELLKKNKIYEYQINLWHTGIKLDRNWKIRIEISSSDFPQYSRNLNTGLNNEKGTKYKPAEQKIYHSKKYLSSIILPVISTRNN